MICINFDPKTLKSIEKPEMFLIKFGKKYKDIISINLNENKLKFLNNRKKKEKHDLHQFWPKNFEKY